jgi:hypothetical protein
MSSKKSVKEMKKYLTTKEGDYYRIVALRNFGNVTKGDKGGLIQNETNLSHENNCWVSGDAIVSGDAKILNNNWATTPLYIQGSKHSLTNSKNGYITIGCETHSFEDWEKNYREISEKNSYTGAEIKEYYEHIKYMIKMGV